MNTLNVEKMGLQEMTQKEQIELAGGNSISLNQFLGLLGIGFAAAALAQSLANQAQELHQKQIDAPYRLLS